MKKLFKGLLKLLLALIIFIAILLALLPIILSSRQTQAWVLQHVNAAMPDDQQVNWHHLQLSWTRGQRIENLAYRDSQLLFTVDSVITEKGLLSLIGRTVNIGTLVAERPRIELILPEPHEETPQPAATRAQKVATAEQTPKTTRPTAQMPTDGSATIAKDMPVEAVRLPIDIQGRLRLRNGHLHVRNTTGTRAMFWHDIEIRSDFESGLRKPIELKITAEQRDFEESGRIEATLAATLLQPDGTLRPEKLQANVEILMQSINIGTVSWIANEQAGAPMLRGVLNANASMNMDGVNNVKTMLEANITDAVASRGPLGNDRFEMGNINITVNASHDENSFTIHQAAVLSPLLNIRSSGNLVIDAELPYPAGDFSAVLTADVARAAMQLPETLNLQEGMMLEEGTLDANLSLTSDGTALTIGMAAELPRLRGRQQEQPLVLDQPVKINLRATLSPSGPEIEDINIRTGFANINGKGNLDDFRASADINLDAAQQTFSNFVDLGERAFSGRIVANGRLMTSDEQTRRFHAGVRSSGIKFQHATDNVFALDQFSTEVGGKLELDTESGMPAAMTDLRWMLQSDPIQASGVIETINLDSAPPAVSGANMRWEVNFNKLMGILESAKIAPEDSTLHGTLIGSCVAEVTDNKLVISAFDANISNLTVAFPGLHIAEPALGMRAAITLSLPPEQPSITITGGILQSSAFSLTTPAMRFHTDSSGTPLLSGQADMTVDLAKLTTVMQKTPPFSEGLKLEGSGKIELRSGPAASIDKGLALRLDGNFENVAIFQPDSPPLREPSMKITSHAIWVNDDGKLKLDPLKIEGTLLNLESTVELEGLPDEPRIRTQATVTTDLGSLGPVISAAAGTPVIIEGHSTATFEWRGPVSPEWVAVVRDGQGAANTRIQRISAYGMHATNAVVTMQANDGRMNFSMNSAVNEGRVVITPVIDVTGVIPRLIVPDNSHVIQNVNLTDELASELLALVHPVFRGSTVLGGTVNLTLERCRIPLSEESQRGPDIRGEFVLNNMELAPRGLLLNIMNTAKLRSRTVKIPEEKIAFRVEDGRIHPSPLNISIDGHKLSIDGSVGLDSSLNYTVNVPVTVDLVGREAFRFLEGSNIAMGIGGTVMRPEISSDAFARMAASLAADALKNAVRQEGREAIKDIQERGEDAIRDLLRQRRR